MPSAAPGSAAVPCSPTTTRSESSPCDEISGLSYPLAFGDWYVAVIAVPTKVTDKGVEMPETTKDKLWYGIVLSSGHTTDRNLDGMAIYFNRPSAIDKLPILDEHGLPVNSNRWQLVAVYKGTIQCCWKIEEGREDEFLAPPATPPDYEWQREKQKQVELR